MLDSDPFFDPPPSLAMPRPNAVKQLARAAIVATLLVALVAGTAGCGQRGPLFLPDKDNPDKRR